MVEVNAGELLYDCLDEKCGNDLGYNPTSSATTTITSTARALTAAAITVAVHTTAAVIAATKTSQGLTVSSALAL